MPAVMHKHETPEILNALLADFLNLPAIKEFLDFLFPEPTTNMQHLVELCSLFMVVQFRPNSIQINTLTVLERDRGISGIQSNYKKNYGATLHELRHICPIHLLEAVLGIHFIKG